MKSILKDIKFRVHRVGQELGDVKKHLKLACKQLKNIWPAIKGHKRKGRK